VISTITALENQELACLDPQCGLGGIDSKAMSEDDMWLKFDRLAGGGGTGVGLTGKSNIGLQDLTGNFRSERPTQTEITFDVVNIYGFFIPLR
jgi:hypothetical protein